MGVRFEGDALVWGTRRIKPSVRKFGDMVPVLMHPNTDTELDPETPTYFMYRGPEQFGHVRYDVTRIPPIGLCGEFNKTFGHMHPMSKKGAYWPEMYEVLEGSAHFVLQKVDQLGVSDAVLLMAKKGECFMVPPGYGHVTINPGKPDLVMGNLVSDLFDSDYSMFPARQGACIYETSDSKVVRNKNYGSTFEIRQLRAAEFSRAYGCYAPFDGSDLLSVAKKKPEALEFLVKPETFY